MKKVITALMGIALLVACSKDDNNQQVTNQQVKEAKYINAKAYETWTYFSFESGKVVSVTDFLNDTNWDIAFHRFDVRTNSGLSGKGKGGYAITEVETLADLKNIPTEFKVDGQGEIIVSLERTAQGRPTEKKEVQPYATEFNWLTYLRPGQPGHTGSQGPEYLLSKKVFVVKTASGKLVKVKFTDHYGADGTDFTKANGGSGFPSFEYQIIN